MKRIVALLLLFVMLFSLCSCRVGFYGDELIVEEGSNELKISVCGVDTLNPIKTKSQSVGEILSLIYSPLFTFNEKLEPEPCLAEDITTLADGVSVKLTLKKDISWHSGEPFTAGDVIYTINEIQRTDSQYKQNLTAVKDAYVNEYGEFILSLKYPVMNIEGLLSFPIIRNGSYTELDESADGLGLYVLEEKSASEMLLKYRGNNTAGIQSVRVSVMRTPTACLNAFESGDLDLISSAVLNLDETTPAGEIKKYYHPSNNLTFLGFNNTKEKYSTPYLRLAISHIIDRDELIEKSLFGMATPSELPINPLSKLYSDTSILEYDIEGMIEEAGYTKTDTRYISGDDEALSAEILVCQENARKVDVANAIAEKLNTAGISAYILPVDYSTYKKKVSAKDYDLFIGEVKMPYNLDPGFLTENGNFFGYSNQELDDLLYEMRNARTDDELNSLAIEYERIFKNDQPFIPLYYKNEGVIYKKTVSGITQPNFYNSMTGLENLYFSSSSKR